MTEKPFLFAKNPALQSCFEIMNTDIKCGSYKTSHFYVSEFSVRTSVRTGCQHHTLSLKGFTKIVYQKQIKSINVTYFISPCFCPCSRIAVMMPSSILSSLPGFSDEVVPDQSNFFWSRE